MLNLLKIIITTAPTSRIIATSTHNVRRFSSQPPPVERVLSTASRQVVSTPTITLTNWPYNLRICPNDILDPNDVNSLRATIVSSDPNAAVPSDPLRIDVADDNNNRVTIVNTAAAGDPGNDHTTSGHLTCVLEVPVQSDLDVTAHRNVHVEKLYSDSVRLCTAGDISTRNLNGFRFNFETDGGHVHCAGNTLAQQIDIRARGHGNIHLAKMQGDQLLAICDSGSIRTESCYSEASKFVTMDGSLLLANVHKFAEMYTLAGGRIEVTGFHGRLQAKLGGEGGSASFQLTEVYGDSWIEADAALTVNLSDFVLENNELNVSGTRVQLDARLAELVEHLSETGDSLRWANPNLNADPEDRLTVRCGGAVQLGKMSWTDTLKAKFNVK